jgi:hypothetical protein
MKEDWRVIKTLDYSFRPERSQVAPCRFKVILLVQFWDILTMTGYNIKKKSVTCISSWSVKTAKKVTYLNKHTYLNITTRQHFWEFVI